MTRFALFFIILFASFTWLGAERKPDVLLIMSDDMGYSDLGCFGGEIRTPALDALADGGVRFTNFYSENMCWVSRASLLTGIYHKTSLKNGALHPRCLTLPEALRKAGYKTLMAGKWHLAGKNGNETYPNDRGFDRFYGILGGASSFFAPYSLSRDRKNVEREYRENPTYYFTRAIAQNALAFLEDVPKDQPLFLYLPFTAAHWPLHAPQEDIEKYKGHYAQGWDTLRKKRLARMKELGVIHPKVALSARHPKVPAWTDEPRKAWQERRMEVYAAQVTIMDEAIGTVVEALRKAGRFENTLTFFTIDNGGCHVEYGTNRKGYYLPEKTRDGRTMKPGNVPDLMPGPEITYQSYGYGWANLSNTPYRLFKQYDHEGGVHTPMIAHWPNGISGKGRIDQSLSHLVDLMPTILDAAKVTPQEQLGEKPRIQWDGHSLLPALQGNGPVDHQRLFFSHAKGMALRKGNWKLVKSKESKGKSKWELYELSADPNETKNLAEEMPEKVMQLSKEWESWEKEMITRAEN